MVEIKVNLLPMDIVSVSMSSNTASICMTISVDKLMTFDGQALGRQTFGNKGWDKAIELDAYLCIEYEHYAKQEAIHYAYA